MRILVQHSCPPLMFGSISALTGEGIIAVLVTGCPFGLNG